MSQGSPCSTALAPLPAEGKRGRLRSASWVPFGIGAVKPRHYLEMLKILWRNRGRWLYAWRILTRGVCDGCALGTTGLRDWTLEGTHLCLVRLNLLELNTARPMAPDALADVSRLPADRPGRLREMGRLSVPLRRRKGERGFTRVSWEEALSGIGARLRGMDPQRVACYMTSRGIGNEVYYATQKAMRLLGSPHIENAARLCHSPSTAAMKGMLGVAASTCSYRDWYGSDVIVLWGSNPANDQPVAMKFLLEAKRLGTRVVVVNPFREPGLARYWVPSTPSSALFGTEIADLFVPVTTGGDIALARAALKRLIAKGAIDRAFIDAHTDGFDALARELQDESETDLLARAGTPLDALERFVDLLAAARTGVFIWSMGITQHGHGTRGVEAILALGLAKGFVGRERCGLVPIRGHSGVQGGAEMGAYATAYPGGKPITKESASDLEALWGFRPPDAPGMDTLAQIDAAERGALDCLYAVGGNFLDTLPQPARVARALETVPLRIHQDIVVTPPMLLEPADEVYVLPAKTRYEHDGGITETSTERRIIFSPKVEGPACGEAREEWRIALDLARAARPERANHVAALTSAQAIREDIARTVPLYAGIERLAKQGDEVQWGGPRLCEGGVFPLPGGKARFLPGRAREGLLASAEADALRLSTRRGKQFNSIVQSEYDGLTGARREDVLLAAEDLRARGLCHGDAILLTSPFGTMRGRAFAAEIARGNAQAHWPEANVLLDPARRDDVVHVPDYNVAVTIARAEGT